MPYLIVEYDHDPPITDEQLAKDANALHDCLDVRGVRWMRSWVSNDRRRGFCEYRADNAEAVREAYNTANVKYLKVWSATLFAPNEFPDQG
jgi:hypothetical protein